MYSAKVTSADGKNLTFPLPKILQEGIVLTVNNSNINKTFASVTRGPLNKSKYNNLIIIAQINYEIAYLGKLNLDEGLDAVAIPKKNLPPGIMQISILHQDGTPLAERLVFVANHPIDSTAITTDLIKTQKREKSTSST